MILLIISIFLGALGQIFLKMASVQESNKLLIKFYLSLLYNIYAWLGFVCYGVSVLFWFKILTKYDISYARPLVSIGYVITALLSIVILDEKVSFVRWIGILLITIGSVFLGLSKE